MRPRRAVSCDATAAAYTARPARLPTHFAVVAVTETDLPQPPPSPDPQGPGAVSPFPSRVEETVPQDTESLQALRDELQHTATEGEQPARPPEPRGYRVLQPLGRGAFGAVWLAEQANTGRRVAIKQYDRRKADWPLMAREVEKLATLDAARNIVRLIEVEWDAPQPWFVMELLTGGSLAERLKAGPLPVETAVRLAEQIARGLRQAHGVGVLHCDLKPGNILLDARELSQAEARLCDFGQARLATEESPALGTLYYMAPEQAAAQARPDARWDVYAFGAVLYQMLTGAPPHRSPQSDAELASADRTERLLTYRRLAEQPVPRVEGVDRALSELVSDCLQPDPAARIPNAQVLLDRLDNRERARQRRPFFWLGLLAPLVFVVLLLLIARQAIPQAVAEAESSLVQQTLNGDELSAQLLAAGLQQDLDVRLAELIEMARREDVVAALEAADEAPGELQALLTAQETRSQAALAASQRRADTSWFVTNDRGLQVARAPRNATIGQRFHWRDYFHGQGREFDPKTTPDNLAPRERAGLSQAFRSRATGQYMVALAVPVRNANGETIGVLARTVHLFALLDAWERRLQAGPQSTPRLLALASTDDDRLARLIDHRWMTRQHVADFEDDALLNVLTFPFATDVFTTTDDYRDPLAAVDDRYAGPWLAAAARVPGTDWLAIVQERQGPVLQPVAQVRTIFFWWGAVLLAVFATLLVAVWLLLARFAR